MSHDPLRSLAVALCDAVDLRTQTTVVVHTTTPLDTGVDVGLTSLDGEHPLSALVGFYAPEEWWSIGTLATGWSGPLSDDDLHEVERGRATRPSTHPDRVRVAICVLVARDGSRRGFIRGADGSTRAEPPGAGLSLDALYRCLGLPTPPPTVPVAELFAALWLHAVEAEGMAARAAGRRLTWRRAVKAFPILGPHVPSSAARDGAAAGAYAFEGVGRLDWRRVREWGTRGGLAGLVGPDLVRWMDEGMLSRWVLSELPPLHVQLDRACVHLSPDDAREVQAAVDVLLLAGATCA